MRRTHRNVIAGAAAAIVILAAVPAASAALHAARGVPAACVRDQLGVRANGTEGTAGTIHGAWVFTNRSDTSCTLNGYPDLQLYGRLGRPITTTVQDTLPPAPSAVVLAPGGAGTFFTSYSDVSPTPCPNSGVMAVTAPGDVNSLFIPARLQPCGGTIQVSAVRAGVHHA